MAKIIVTGGRGFIGSHLCGALLEQGHQVIVPTSRVEDKQCVDYEFNAIRPDYVYHLAGYSKTYDHVNRSECYLSNVVGTANIVESCIKYGVKKLIYTSSNLVYGALAYSSHNNEYTNNYQEDSEYYPHTPYALSKLTAEEDIKMALDFGDQGTEYTIFRLANVFGPNQGAKATIRHFMNCITSKQPITLTTSLYNRFHFTYVRDILPVMLRCIINDKLDNMTFNLCNPESNSLGNLFDCLREITGIQESLISGAINPDFPIHNLEIKKLEDKCGKVTFTPFKQALKETWEHNQR